jgi:hypothetical protein
MIDMSEQALTLMKAIGSRFGVDLAIDHAGACGMRVDDRIDVTLRYETNPPAILAYAVAGDLPRQDEAATLRGLLEANHVWDGSRGATWSLDNDRVVLSRLFALQGGLEIEPFIADLEAFVDVALTQQRALESEQTVGVAASSVMSDMLMHGAIAP